LLDHIYDDLGYVDASVKFVKKLNSIFLVVQSWTSRAKNVGWRIDYQACSPTGKTHINAWVYKDEWYSDHAPVD
jgi:exodeoxyribonuclease-3